jgi:hypothetical protein
MKAISKVSFNGHLAWISAGNDLTIFKVKLHKIS